MTYNIFMKKLLLVFILFFGIQNPTYANLSDELSAAKSGDSIAQYDLGLIYYSKENYTEAGKWMRLAAIAGNVDAQIFLGQMFKEGKGFAVEIPNAIYWVSRAANNGSKEAKAELKLLKELYLKIKAQKIKSESLMVEKLKAEKLKAEKIKAEAEKKKADDKKKRQAKLDSLVQKLKQQPQIFWGSLSVAVIFIWILIHILGAGKREREKQLKIEELARIADRKKKEDDRIQREKEEEEKRLHQLAMKEEKKRIYALQQKKLVYLKADKYLSEFESHLPFKLSANYSDLRVFYDEKSSSIQTDFIENFKDNRLWDALVSLLVDDHPLDTMSTIYFAKIRSLLDDENYLVIGETDLDINDFFDRSTQLELVELISSCLMPKPLALFVILHLSREFRYLNEEERAETEFKLEHFIVKENSKVKIQKLFTKLDEYALKCINSYADISSKEYDELESNQEGNFKAVKREEGDFEADEEEDDFEVFEKAIKKTVKKTKKPKNFFDVEKYLEGIIKIGGQAIAKVPMKKFVDYVHKYGEQLPSQAGTVHGLVKIDNKMYKVEFTSGVFHNLNDGETLIVITRKSHN